MNVSVKTLCLCGALSLLTACGGAPTKQESAKADPYPDWYYSPADSIANALNAASCVAIPGGNLEIARKQALANGRADIASQIETRVKAMDKTYDRLANTDEGSSVGGTFESVSKQVTNQVMSGVRAVKSARVDDSGKPYFCSLVSLDPEKTSQLVDQIIAASGVNISGDSESVLREQFNAYKAQQEMESAMGSY